MYHHKKVITKDNVQVEIDTIIFYQIVEPELATYGISNYEMGCNITSATMRQIIGKMESSMKHYQVVKKFQQKFV